MIPVRDIMTNGIAKFSNVQIHDFAHTKYEIFTCDQQNYFIHIGKNTHNATKNPKTFEPVITTDTASGNYYYWWTLPLVNYYHCMLDGIGHLHCYFKLREQMPDLQLLVNCNPRPKGGVVKHPSFVAELLDLFDIEYQYTNSSLLYENVYYGSTLGQDTSGVRIRPADEQYVLLTDLIKRAHSRTSAPKYDKIYLSRRAHANPLNNRKAIIGEDNTTKRGITNEDEMVDILTKLGYTEVFGENYTLAEKIVMFNSMEKYITSAGAGVTNILWTMPNNVNVGGIHSPGFPFPGPGHKRHICVNPKWINAQINLYPGRVCFVDPVAGAKNYNSPWYINNLEAFRKWAETI